MPLLKKPERISSNLVVSLVYWAHAAAVNVAKARDFFIIK